MDVIRGQVVAGDGEPDPRIAKKPISEAVLQHCSQSGGVVSRPQESSQQPVTCSSRPWEDVVAVFEIYRQDLAVWIDTWYNQRRLHSTNNMTSPIEYELANAA
jgi:hypothetical protein